jgi:hypothetical protein
MAFFQQTRVRIAAGVIIILILAAGVWVWASGGSETTDDAQADGRCRG